MQKIVLKAIRDLGVFVQEFEPVFLYLMDQKSNKEQKQEMARLEQTLRKCTDITELNRDFVNRLIQRIEVHNNDKYDGHCHVKVDIYFTGAGIINIPTEQELLKLMDEIRNSRPNEQSA